VTSRRDLDRKLIAAAERLGRALRAARQHVATQHGLSLLQLQLLEQLSDRRPRRVGELAAELDISQPTTSDALRILQEKDLVARAPDPTDRRASTIALTDSGDRVAAAIAAQLGPLLTGERAEADDERGIALRVLLGEILRLQTAGVISVNRSCLSCLHFQPAGRGALAHCLLLDEPLADRELRVDCPEHSSLSAVAT
jgi:DNA-binding MarR family transcriptional regulator